MKHREPNNRQTTDFEIATNLLIATQYFGGNIEKAIGFVRGRGLMPKMLSKSRFNRSMHAIGELLAELFFHIERTIKHQTLNHTYSIDSFPVAVAITFVFLEAV